MKKKIFANWGLKLVALFLALGTWCIFVYIENPPGEAVFSDIEVTFLNEELLQEQNQVSEVLEGTDLIQRVTVKGPRQTLDEMKLIGASVTATADFAKMRDDFTIPVEFSVPSQFAGEVEDIILTEGSPVVKLLVEPLKSKNVRVKGETTGEVREDYQLTEVRTDVNMITVTGATSRVDAIDHAAVVQDVSGADSDITASGSILLFDADGNQLDSTNLQRSLFATGITVRISATKVLPIEYEVFGEPEEGYLATGKVESTQESIKVAGSSSVLNGLTSIVVGGEGSPVDITGATGSQTREFNIRNYLSAAGVQLAKDAGDGLIRVTVGVEHEVENVYTVPAANISLINIPEDMGARLSQEQETYALRLKGLREAMDQVNAESITGTVDVGGWIAGLEAEELKPGKYSVRAQFELPGGVSLVSPVEVEIEIPEQ